MARKTWIGTGGVDGDWGDAANWLGGLPVAGDTIMIDSQSVVSPTINLSALAGVLVASFDVSPGAVSLEMGTESAYLQMQSSRLRWEASGSKGAIEFVTTQCDAQIVTGPTSPNSLLIAGLLSMASVGVAAGGCRVTNQGAATSIVGTSYIGASAQLVIDALPASGPIDLSADGQVNTSETINQATMAGSGSVLVTGGAAAINALFTSSGSRVQHDGTGDIGILDAQAGGTITTHPESTVSIGVSSQVVASGEARIQASPAVKFPNGVQVVSSGSPLSVAAGTVLAITPPVDS